MILIMIDSLPFTCPPSFYCTATSDHLTTGKGHEMQMGSSHSKNDCHKFVGENGTYIKLYCYYFVPAVKCNGCEALADK